MVRASLFGMVLGIAVLGLSIAGIPTNTAAWDSTQTNQVTSAKIDKQARLQIALQAMLKQAQAQHAVLERWQKKQLVAKDKSAATTTVGKVRGGLEMTAAR